MDAGQAVGGGFLSLALLLAACGSTAEPTTAALSLRYLDSCNPGPASRLSLTATGDFPARTAELSLQAPVTLDDMPADTRWLRLQARADSVQLGAVIDFPRRDLERDVLLLPLGRSCPLGDPLARLPPGAAAVALDDAGLLIVGGRDTGGAARSSAVRLAPGDRLVEQVSGGMLLRRSAATASQSGLFVVVAGGAPDERGPAHDTFEVYDRSSGRFEPALSAKLAHGPRRDHAALGLADGRVLLVGGRPEVDAAPLRRAERLDPATGRAEDAGAMIAARTAPRLFRLDDGQVLVAGGLDRDGRTVTTIERFDPAAGAFEVVAEAPDGPRDALAVAALPGARLAWLGCAFAPALGAGACSLSLLLLSEGAAQSAPVALRGADPEAAAFFPDPATAAAPERLEQVRLLGLDDGRLLLTGRAPDRVSRERVALLLDPSTATAHGVEASRVPTRLLALADGSVAELAASGASLRRQRVATPFDDPPADPIGDGAYSLDAPSRWSVAGRALRAEVEGARLDLPHLRYARARVSLELTGEGALLLLPPGAAPRRLALEQGQLAIDECSLERPAGVAIEVRWEPPELHLAAGQARRRCPLAGLPRPLRFGLVLSRGAVLEGLHIERL